MAANRQQHTQQPTKNRWLRQTGVWREGAMSRKSGGSAIQLFWGNMSQLEVKILK